MSGSGGHCPLTSQMSAPTAYQSFPAQSHPQMSPQQPQMSPQQPQMMTQPKEINAALFCRVGQEAVHDLVSKASELFQLMGKLQLPNGVISPQMYQEKKGKIDEGLRIILQTFQKLRLIYSKVNEISMHIIEPSEELLIPIVGSEVEQTSMNNDVYRYVAEEHRDIVEQVRMKNQEIKDIIDQIRSIIWEINTMITMRKT